MTLSSEVQTSDITVGMTSPDESRSKVSMYPAQSRTNDNPFIEILCQGLNENLVDVVPFTPGRTRALADAFHIHWLEKIFWGKFASRSTWIQKYLAQDIIRTARRYRAASRPVVWTAHNLNPHDGMTAERQQIFDGLVESFMPLVTDCIVMDEAIVDSVRTRYPQLSSANFHLIQHPNFTNYFEKLSPFRDAKNIHDVPKGTPLLVSVGKIRAYKGLPALVRELRKLTVDFRLLIAGDGDNQEICRIRSEASDDHRIILDIRTLSDSDVAALLSTSDAAIFNFSSILNSGSVLSALSLSTPVICPRLGAIAGLQRRLGEFWVRTFEQPLAAEDISQALRSLPTSKAGICDLTDSAPATVGLLHAKIYRSPRPDSSNG